MVFITISVFSVLLWLWLGKLKLLSVSFANLMGTLIFVALGLYFDPVLGPGTTIIIGIGFYLFLVIGERCANLLPINKKRIKRFGEALAAHPGINLGFTVFFFVFAFLPLVQVLSNGLSIIALYISVWATNTVAATSQRLIDLSSQSASGFTALMIGIQNQLLGFWYLSLGMVMKRKRRWFYPVILVYLLGSFLTSGGFRSLLMVSILLPVLLYLLSAKKAPQLRTILLLGVLSLCILLSLDFLRNGRSGMATVGSLQDRVERTLRTDFAFGGLGLKVGLSNSQLSLGEGINYLVRTAVLPIPRVIWPGKPSFNPNQVLTEAYTGIPFAQFGTILLFTPLGEALFYFGYFGIILIPFLYGFITRYLEKIYSTSNVYIGLLAQVYIWAFLSMRLTFFNLFSTLIAGNFILICMLVVGARSIPIRRLPLPRPVMSGHE